MADLTIPREAVDKAALAYYAAVKPRISQRAPAFDNLPEGTRALAFAEAEAALNAAAPHIVAAELERIAMSIDVGGGLAADDYWNRAEAEGRKTLKMQLAARAVSLRAQA